MDLKYKAIMKVERVVRIFYQATDFMNKMNMNKYEYIEYEFGS